MTCDLTFWVVTRDLKKMFRETHFYLTFGLTNLLDTTPFACDAVDEVLARAIHVESAHVHPSRCKTRNSPIFVELRAIPTIVWSQTVVGVLS